MILAITAVPFGHPCVRNCMLGSLFIRVLYINIGHIWLRVPADLLVGSNWARVLISRRKFGPLQ